MGCGRVVGGELPGEISATGDLAGGAEFDVKGE